MKLIKALLFFFALASTYLPAYAQEKATISPYTLLPDFQVGEKIQESTDSWEALVVMQIKEKPSLNPQFNKLVGAILEFTNKRQAQAKAMGLIIYAPVELHEFLTRAVPYTLSFAVERGNKEYIKALKIGVTLSDPVTEHQTTFKVGAKE